MKSPGIRPGLFLFLCLVLKKVDFKVNRTWHS